MKRFLALFLFISIVFSLFGCANLGDLTEELFNPAKLKKYNEAIEHIEQKEYDDAYALFVEIGDFKDVTTYLARFHRMPVGGSEYGIDADGQQVKRYLTVELNEQNLPAVITVTDLEGNLYQSTELTYDSQNRLSNKIVGGEYRPSKYVYNYDFNGDLDEIVFTDSFGKVLRYRYDYTDDGQLLYNSCTGSNGIGFSNEYLYNSDGTLSYEANYDQNGPFPRVVHYKYNKDGVLTEREIRQTYEELPDQVCWTKYTYGENGQLLNATHSYNYTSDTVSVDYTYDADGNIATIRRTQTNNGIPEWLYTYSYTYDEQGNITKEIYETSESTTTTRYTYDQYGNILKGVTDSSNPAADSSFSVAYKLVYIPFDMTEEEFEERIVNGIFELDDAYPSYPDP